MSEKLNQAAAMLPNPMRLPVQASALHNTLDRIEKMKNSAGLVNTNWQAVQGLIEAYTKSMKECVDSSFYCPPTPVYSMGTGPASTPVVHVRASGMNYPDTSPASSSSAGRAYRSLSLPPPTNNKHQKRVSFAAGQFSSPAPAMQSAPPAQSTPPSAGLALPNRSALKRSLDLGSVDSGAKRHQYEPADRNTAFPATNSMWNTSGGSGAGGENPSMSPNPSSQSSGNPVVDQQKIWLTMPSRFAK